MNKISRGFVSILLSLSAVLFLMGFSLCAYAEEETQTEESTVDPDICEVYDDQLTYYINSGGTITIVSSYSTDTEGKDISEIEVPAEIDGRKVTEIGADCFRELAALKTVTLPDSVEILSPRAFYSCTVLEKVNTPKNLRVIDSSVFYSCEKLEEFDLPSGLESIGYQSFYGCQLIESFSIPKSCTEIGDYAFEGCIALEEINVDEKNSSYSSDEGILFNKDKTTLIKYPEKYKETDYTVPKTVKRIENWAFIGCTELKSIDLGSVSEIGEDAFYYCTSLESIQIPEGVEKLVGAAFGYCIKLENAKLPSTLKSIGKYCFYCCMSLEGIELPQSLETIEEYAFFYCAKMQGISIPPSVELIGDYALGYKYDSDNQSEVRLDDFSIDCSEGSAAQEYAQKNDFAQGGSSIFSHKLSLGSFSVYTWLVFLIGFILIAAMAAAVISLIMLRKNRINEKQGSKKKKTDNKKMVKK